MLLESVSACVLMDDSPLLVRSKDSVSEVTRLGPVYLIPEVPGTTVVFAMSVSLSLLWPDPALFFARHLPIKQNCGKTYASRFVHCIVNASVVYAS